MNTDELIENYVRSSEGWKQPTTGAIPPSTEPTSNK